MGIPEVDATGNWWGTTDEASIEGSIHDWNDDASLGRVVYQPFAPAPVSEAPPIQHSLTLSNTTGGSVTTPGEGTFACAGGTVVDLVAEADEGYRFVQWTGDTGTIGDADAAQTTVTMNGDYSITAGFETIPAQQYHLILSSTTGGSVTTPGEGIEALKEAVGSVDRVLAQLIGGIQSGMGYQGAGNLGQLRENARFIRVSAAGMKEAAPHHVVELMTGN